MLAGVRRRLDPSDLRLSVERQRRPLPHHRWQSPEAAARRSSAPMTPRYLRVVRNGEQFQFRYSWNGTRWFTMRQLHRAVRARRTIGVVTDRASDRRLARRRHRSSTTSRVGRAVRSPTTSQGFDDLSFAPICALGDRVNWTTRTPRPTPGSITVRRSTWADASSTTSSPPSTRWRSTTSTATRRTSLRPRAANDSRTRLGELASFTTLPCPPLVSDDFSGAELGAQWTLFEPLVAPPCELPSSTSFVVSIPAGSRAQPVPGGERRRTAAPVSTAGRLRRRGEVRIGADDPFPDAGHRGRTGPRATSCASRSHHDGSPRRCTSRRSRTTSPTRARLRVGADGARTTICASSESGPGGPSRIRPTTSRGAEIVDFDVVDQREVRRSVHRYDIDRTRLRRPSFVGSIDYFFDARSAARSTTAARALTSILPVLSDVAVTPGDARTRRLRRSPGPPTSSRPAASSGVALGTTSHASWTTSPSSPTRS